MFGRKGHLKPAWSYHATGVLWRLVPAAGGILIGEVRDVDGKKTWFVALDERTGTPLWRDKTFGEDWWIGIEAVGNAVLYLHTFAKPDMPHHRGIIAVDIASGEQLWHKPDVTFEWLDNGVVTASRTTSTGKETLYLDACTGTSITASGTPRQQPDNERADLASPIPVSGFAGQGNMLAGVLRSTFKRTLLDQAAEYIDYHGYVVFSYLAASQRGKQQTNPDQFISVLRRHDGSLLYDAIMNDNTPALLPGNFFVASGTLLFVRNRSELIALHLPPISPESTIR